MDDLTSRLEALLQRQRKYNLNVRDKDTPQDEDENGFWTAQYVHGLHEEAVEVLAEVEWKRHKKHRRGQINRRNLGLQFADNLKYLLSLCELWGITAEELITCTEEKSFVLEEQWRMEHSVPPLGRKILLTDIDGTLADWRTSFILWAGEIKNIDIDEDLYDSLLIDASLGMSYPNYNILKEEFESDGWYANLLPYSDAIETVQAVVKSCDAYLVVYTARPAYKLRNIWLDTWHWLQNQGINPDLLEIGSEPRILTADRLRKHNQIALLEDDPGLIIRAANSGLRVFARRLPYNNHIKHPGVTFVDFYEPGVIIDYLSK